MAVDWLGYGYAALIASGGVMGYVKAGSVPSLAAGMLFGGLAGFGAYKLSHNSQDIWVSLGTIYTMFEMVPKDFQTRQQMAACTAVLPVIVLPSVATSGTLAALMGKRFYNSQKLMPAGIVAGASVLMLAKLGVGVLQKPQDS